MPMNTPEELEREWNKHEKSLWGVCFEILRNADDADDALQEAYIRAHKAWGRFREEAQPKTWLTRICTNRCIDRQREKRRTPEQSYSQTSDMEDYLSGQSSIRGNCIEDDYIQKALRSKVKAEVAKLSVEYRIVIHLYYIEQLSYDEIVEVLGISLGKVKTRLFRARKQLHSRLEYIIEEDN